MGDKSQDHRRNLAEAIREDLASRRTFLKTTGLLGGGLLLGGQALLARPRAAHAQDRPRRGGQIKVAWIDTVDTLDPHFTSSLAAIKIHDNIYNGILKVEFNGRRVSFVPELAEKWEMPDPVTHVLTLRKGVRFHDGEECTAETIKWNQERVRSPEMKSPHAWKLAYLDRVEVLDRYRLKITF